MRDGNGDEMNVSGIQEKPKDVEEIDSPVLVSSQTVCGYEIVGQFLGVLVACGLSVLPFVVRRASPRTSTRTSPLGALRDIPTRPAATAPMAQRAPSSPSFSALSRKINC